MINIEFSSSFQTKNAISVQNNQFFIKIILTNDFEFAKNVFVVVNNNNNFSQGEIMAKKKATKKKATKKATKKTAKKKQSLQFYFELRTLDDESGVFLSFSFGKYNNQAEENSYNYRYEQTLK